MLNIIKKEVQEIVDYYKDYDRDYGCDEGISNIIMREVDSLLQDHKLPYKCVSVILDETNVNTAIIDIHKFTCMPVLEDSE